MDNNVKISIIIPVYNTEEYLRQCLDSVCNQTMKELQVICVDDGSTDSSLSILEEYRKRDSRFIVLHNKHTGKGAASARNKGLEYAIGEYLLILDSDDYFELDLAEKVYNRAKETNADVVLYDAKFLDEYGRHSSYRRAVIREALPDKEVFNSSDCPNTIFQVSSGMAWSKLWKHSFIRENKIRFQEQYLVDDALFTYSALAIARRISVLSERLVNYRYARIGSQSANKDVDPCVGIRFLEELKKFLVGSDLYESLKISYWHQVFQICWGHLRSFNTYDAFKVHYSELKSGVLRELLDNDDWETEFANDSYKDGLALARKNVIENMKQLLTLEEETFLFKRFTAIGREVIFPDDLVKKTDKVVLYGAGAIGRAFFNKNFMFQYCQIVGWADRQYGEKGFPICAPEQILKMDYDKLIIAIEREELAVEIRTELINMGVDVTKIIWRSPR